MNARILVVDDEKSIRMTLEHFLTEEGYEVETASSYDDAYEMLSETYFDLIITDILLGDKSGIDLLREIKRRHLTCPVIMITGAPDIHTATEALRLGAFDYVSKPVKKDAILRVAGVSLKHKHLNDEKEKYRLHLETIFNTIHEGIITVDDGFRVTEMNGAAKKICGFSGEQVGMKIDALSNFCNGKCADVLRECIADRQSVWAYRHECSHSKFPGKLVSIRSSPMLDQQGAFSGAMLVITDEGRPDTVKNEIRKRQQYHAIIGQSAGMQQLYALIGDLADVSTTVLITGESGTGKELVADALHFTGIRRDEPLIKVNCSALQENLLESELFGHVKGAFTGAIQNKTGRFQMADGGTIFLDEIGDISKNIQLKLLRVLQDKEFERVGDAVSIKSDVRVIAATNQDLRKKVGRGEFREDLYYRLKVVELPLLSLRERKEDIPLLLDHFIRKFNEKIGRNIEGVSGEVVEQCMEYQWPGNIRELEHAIEHAVVLCHGKTITLDHLPPELKDTDSSGVSPDPENHDIVAEAIVQALEKCDWNKAKAARLLGISRPTLYRKIKELNLDRS